MTSSPPVRATYARAVLRVGLTGGIGAGKSTVATRLAELGAVVVDADQIAREVVAPGTEGLAEVVATFGPQVLTPNGELDRAALGRIVFSDEAARHRLEAITHPRIADATAAAFAAVPADSVGVHDVPLLVEKQLAANYHLVVVVHADVDERIRRLVTDRGMTAAEARSRLAAQASDGARRRVADIWLDNTRGSADLLELVDTAWRRRVAPFATNLAMRRPAEGTGDRPDDVAQGRLVARLQRAVGERAVVSVCGTDLEVRGVPHEDLVAAVERAGYAPSADATAAGAFLTCDPAWAGTAVTIVG